MCSLSLHSTIAYLVSLNRHGLMSIVPTRQWSSRRPHESKRTYLRTHVACSRHYCTPSSSPPSPPLACSELAVEIPKFRASQKCIEIHV